MKKIWLLTTLLIAGLLLSGCFEKVQDCISWEAACTEEIKIEEPIEENVLVVQDEDMNTENIVYLKIWDKTFDVTLEENSATKALIEKLHEWNAVVLLLYYSIISSILC